MCVCVCVHSNDERVVVCVFGFTVMTSVLLCVCVWVHSNDERVVVCGCLGS